MIFGGKIYIQRWTSFGWNDDDELVLKLKWQTISTNGSPITVIRQHKFIFIMKFGELVNAQAILKYFQFYMDYLYINMTWKYSSEYSSEYFHFQNFFSKFYIFLGLNTRYLSKYEILRFLIPWKKYLLNVLHQVLCHSSISSKTNSKIKFSVNT